jgi:uncharacterized protein (TIGR02145 family)
MNKVVLVASLLAVLMFMFSCSSDEPEPALCAGEEYDTNTYRCKGNELVGKCRENDYYPAYEVCNNGVIEDKFGFFIDSRDEQIYKWVKIGNQTWMAENLRFDMENSECLSLPYGPDCKLYGKSYYWSEAMEACPNGWHLSTDREWQELVEFTGDKLVPYYDGDYRALSDVGKKLIVKNEGGSDEYGFSALHGRSYWLCKHKCEGVYDDENEKMLCLGLCRWSYHHASFWTTTRFGSGYVYEILFHEHIFLISKTEVEESMSKIRCVQN